MSPLKNLVNSKIVIAIVTLLIIIAVGATLYLGSASSRLSKELKQEKSGSGALEKENAEMQKNLAKLKEENDKLARQFESISVDRDNLLTQAKRMLGDKARSEELSAALEEAKKDAATIRKENQELLDQNLLLKEKKNDLEMIQKQLLREKEQLAESLEKAKDASGIRRLEQEKAALKKENTDLSNGLKAAKAEINKLKESQAAFKDEVRQLTAKVKDLDDRYAEAVKKNKALEQRVEDAPHKFAEIARQNKVLIRRTSNMHYNLGVFYLQQKEYNRAAAEFEKAVELTPDDAYAHFNLGYIYAEYLVNRTRAVEHFRQYLRYAKKDDKDVDWVKKYLLTWQSWQGKETME